MKTLFVTLIIILFVGFSFPLKSFDLSKQQKNQFTVIELFTSEGCSSCPPADEIFNDLVKKNNPNLIAIAFHVDYWDRLGWKDSFSDTKWTSRQGDYREYFRNQSIYTPQLIVNGTQEFVGSNEEKVINSLQKKIKIENQIDLNLLQKNNNLIIDYAVTGSLDNKSLTLILVQKQAKVFVKRGENSGKNLFHTNIARDINQINELTKSGQVSLKIPSELNSNDYFVVGLIQNKTNKIISGILKI